jgi:5-methyltetrahydrofolate--homocysteine methyltransferase
LSCNGDIDIGMERRAPGDGGHRDRRRLSAHDLVDYIDWSPFFNAWELAGRYPAILDDEIVGKEARELFKDARAFLDKLVAERWLIARCVFGFFPANAIGDDDIALFADESRSDDVAEAAHAAPADVAQRGAQSAQPVA